MKINVIMIFLLWVITIGFLAVAQAEIPVSNQELSDSRLSIRIIPSRYEEEWDIQTTARGMFTNDRVLDSFDILPVPRTGLIQPRVFVRHGAFGILSEPAGIDSSVFLLPYQHRPRSFQISTQGKIRAHDTNRAGQYKVNIMFPSEPPSAPPTVYGKWKRSAFSEVEVHITKAFIREIIPSKNIDLQTLPSNHILVPFSRLQRERYCVLELVVQLNKRHLRFFLALIPLCLYIMIPYFVPSLPCLETKSNRKKAAICLIIISVSGVLCVYFFGDPNLTSLYYHACLLVFVTAISLLFNQSLIRRDNR